MRASCRRWRSSSSAIVPACGLPRLSKKERQRRLTPSTPTKRTLPSCGATSPTRKQARRLPSCAKASSPSSCPRPDRRRPGAKAQRKSAKAKKSKPIEKIEDLKGRRIGVVGHSLANTEVLDVILKQYQIAPDNVTVVPLDPRDIDGSLRGNPVHVIFAIGPVASPVIADAIAASTHGKTAPYFAQDRCI